MSYFSDPHEIQRRPVPPTFNDIYFDFFSKINISYMSGEITKRLKGIHPEGKNILIPDKTLISVMDSIYTNTPRDISVMTMMTISYIVDHITNEFVIEAQNKKLSIWTTNFGPETGLRQYSKIKLREKKIDTMQFNYNY